MLEPTRKLAAIMFTDIAGFTALSAHHEEKALELIDEQRCVLKPIVAEFNGEWLKEIGDGLLLSFPSSKQAVNCAIKIQQTVKEIEDLNLRIGIHQGDILEKGGDVFGDDVNIASRIEAFSAIGGVAISQKVRGDISGSPEFELKLVGTPKLKGVKQRIRIYCITSHDLPETDLSKVSAKLEQESKPTRRSFKLYPLIVSGLALAILVFFLYPKVFSEKTKLALNSKSIAVLPFAAFSTNEEDVVFANGVQDDILTQLSKIKDIMLISRTSVMQYRNTTKSIKAIAKELKVHHILEGSVRRAGNQIRIVAQLIDAVNDKHIWAETYDRNYTNIFAIQSDVAQKIATALNATLTPKEKAYIEKKPTANMEAYDFYLRGNDYFHQGLEKYSRKKLKLALEMYEKAIRQDSTFALAYAKLALVSFEYLGIFPVDDLEARAKEVVDKALQLDPNLPEAHLALGVYFSNKFNTNQALQEFTFVQERQPGNSDVYFYLGILNRGIGKLKRGLTYFKKAANLDPSSGDKACMIGGAYLYLRNYPESIRYHDRAIALTPDRSCPYSCKAVIYLVWKGDTEQARAALEEASRKGGLETNPSIISVHFLLDVFDGQYQKALTRLGRILNKDIFHRVRHILPTKFLAYAEVYRLMNEPQLELAYYDSARIRQEARVEEFPDIPRYHSLLGIAYAGLGRKVTAIREGELAVSLPIATKEVYQREYATLYLAKIYSMVGEYDLALDKIELALSQPGHISIPLLRADPTWGGLRDYPRFKKLIAGG